MRIFILFFFILNFAATGLKAEGTKELEPGAGQGRTKLEIGTDRVYNFGTYTSTPDKKIYIHIEDPATEIINLGFGAHYHVGGDTVPLYYRIKDPSGTIVSPGALLPDSGKGFIKNYQEAAAGPKGIEDVVNGYEPIVFKPAVKGDYVIEFSTNNKEEKNELKENRVLLDHFDVTVSKSNAKIPGRLWAYVWNLYSCGFSEKSFSKFFVYTKDSLVSSIDMNGLNPCSFAVMSNSKGTTSSLQFSESRKSGQGDIAFPEYKIFFNLPDSVAYAQDRVGVKLGKPLSATGCSQGDFCININTIKGGKGTLLLDFNRNGRKDKEDLLTDLTLRPGDTCIAWNGTDALGNAIPSGSKVKAVLQLHKGLTNFPLYDAERNSNGFKVNTYTTKLLGTPTSVYWDDSNLSLPTSAEKTNLIGCLYSQKPTQGCHTWSQPGNNGAGNNNTFNTWWFASQTKDSVEFEIIQLSPVDAGEDKISCNNSSIIDLGISERIPLDVQASWTELSTPLSTIISAPKQNNTKVNLNGTTKDSISYVLTHTKGSCTISDTVNILINNNKPAIKGKDNACSIGEEFYWANNKNAVKKRWLIPKNAISFNLFGDSIKINSWGPGPLPRTEIIQVVSEYTNCPSDTGLKFVTLTDKIKTPKPVGDTLVCEGTKGNIYRVPFSRNKFQWMSDDRLSTTSSSNIINVNWPAPPYKHKIYVKEMDPQGCMDFSDTLFVTIIPKKPIFSKRDTSICSNDSINLGSMINTPSVWKNFYWTPSTGINRNNISNPAFSVYRTSPDTIKYKVTAISDGCEVEDSIKIAVRPSAVVTDIKNIIPCEDSLVSYDAIVKNATSIDWSVMDDSAKTVSFTPLTSLKDKIQVFWKSKQTPATVKVSVKGACGTDTASVRVVPRKYEHYPPSGPSIPCFAGDEVLSYNVRSNGGKKFKWAITPAGIGQFQGRTDTSEVKIKWTREGVAALLVSEQGAEDSLCPVPPDTLYILITNKGLIDAGKDTTICKGTQATLQATGGISYVWFPKNKPGETLTGEVITPTLLATTDYIVKRTDKCRAQDTVRVTVRPLPANFLVKDKSPVEFCFDDDNAALLLNAQSGYRHYLWKPTLDTTTSISVTKNDMDSPQQQFTLFVTDTLGCTGSDSILVSFVCAPHLYLPTAFSPNGDNINDKLEIFGNYFTNFEMKIYNRWGEVVFITQDRSRQWDGNYNGQPAPEGVYPWTITYDSQKVNDAGNPYKIKGSITLIR